MCDPKVQSNNCITNEQLLVIAVRYKAHICTDVHKKICVVVAVGPDYVWVY
jgi:hypothetical protein